MEFGALGAEAVEESWGVVDGEAGVGLAAEGVEDFSFGGALVGEDAAVVELGESGDVPGVGGVPSSALGGVALVPDEGGGAEEVDRPSSARPSRWKGMPSRISCSTSARVKPVTARPGRAGT